MTFKKTSARSGYVVESLCPDAKNKAAFSVFSMCPFLSTAKTNTTLMRRTTILSQMLFWLLAMPISLMAQTREVSGTITNSKGEPVPAATVQQKGTSTSVVANDQGRYSITVTGASVTLLVSSSGFTATEFPIGNAASYDIQLKESGSLSEVVVTAAFGVKQRKKTLGYNVQEVNSGELAKGKENSFINALQGKVSGVNITSTGGAPGAGTDIVIRGISSLNPGANNQPLIIIDGIPVDNSTVVGSLMPSAGSNGNQAASRDQFATANRGLDINPDDIESISVLKGAGATALYGLQAANGVLIITTKKGSAGKMIVSAGSSVSVDFLTKWPEIQKKYREGQGGRVNIAQTGLLGTRFQTFGPQITANDRVYENFRDAFDNGARYNNNVSVQGGNGKSTYYTSFSSLNQKGMIPTTKYNRYTFKLAGSTQVTDKVNVNGSATLTSSKNIQPSAGDKGIMTALSYHTTTVDVRDYVRPDGTINSYAGSTIDNPLYVARYSQLQSNLFRFVGNMGFSYNILKGLRFDYKIGGDFYGDNRTRIVPGPLFPGAVALDLAAATGGFIAEDRVTFRDVTSNAFLTYNNKFSGDFDYSVLVGNTIQNTYTDLISARGEGFSSPLFYDLSNTANLYNNRLTTRRRYAGIFGTAKVGFRNALYLEVSGRNDYSSTLPPGNNSFFYPATSLSYVFTDLHHISGSVLNYGKFRASYAQVGKDAAPYSDRVYYYPASGFPFNGVGGIRRGGTYADFSLLPEKQKSIEFGTELHFLNDRITLDVSAYQSKNVDQILSVPISYASGYFNYLTNSGSIRNRGLEVELGGSPIKTDAVVWNATINWSMNRSKVLSIKEGITEIPFYNEGRLTNKLVVGGSAGDLYGIAYQRSATGELIINDNPASAQYGRPMVTPSASNLWVKVGNAIPDWIGSLNNSVSYKGFNLSFLLEVKKGGDMMDVTMRNSIRNGVLKITESRYEQVIFSGVKATDGRPNDIPTILDENYYRDADVFNNIADVIVQDASWVRLRNVSIGYELPGKWLSAQKVVKSANISVTGSNFILQTPYKGYDPQSTAYGSGYNVYGFTGSNIPNYSSVIFSLNATF
ncbi:MAG: SusC/RagA family TonB-linked outer membrane protein [Chitinophagaceae bacterium]|nr:MAG: SusC/RagA family TonB-linked outer membrane protein [Chitinophagaceae bacterium]